MPEGKKLDISPSIAIIVAGVLVAGAIVFTNFYTPSQNTLPVEAAGTASPVSVRTPSPSDHWRGSTSAPIVLVEYSDFQCPYCASIHSTLKRIVDESNGQIAWVYRHFPLDSIHAQARPAAVASECIAEQLGEAGFWAFADRVFTDKRPLNTEYFGELALSLGANSVSFNACVASGKYEAKVSADYNEAIKNGGEGTPFTIVVGGGLQVPFAGALPYANIMAVIKTVTDRQQ